MAMLSLLRRMNSAATTHGFRSSFRDWVGDKTNFPGELAELALAHKVGDATEQAYRRGDGFEKRRRIMDAWARFCIGRRRDSVIQMGRKPVAASAESWA